jgi:hypothetical protein
MLMARTLPEAQLYLMRHHYAHDEARMEMRGGQRVFVFDCVSQLDGSVSEMAFGVADVSADLHRLGGSTTGPSLILSKDDFVWLGSEIIAGVPRNPSGLIRPLAQSC